MWPLFVKTCQFEISNRAIRTLIPNFCKCEQRRVCVIQIANNYYFKIESMFWDMPQAAIVSKRVI